MSRRIHYFLAGVRLPVCGATGRTVQRPPGSMLRSGPDSTIVTCQRCLAALAEDTEKRLRGDHDVHWQHLYELRPMSACGAPSQRTTSDWKRVTCRGCIELMKDQ